MTCFSVKIKDKFRKKNFLDIKVFTYITIIFYYFQQYRDIGWFSDKDSKSIIKAKLVFY